jgi:L-asparagine transporter-like permease
LGSSSTLARTLGLRELTLIVIGSVIGSGIFIGPGTVLSQTGYQVGPALLVWLAGGVLSLLGALTYAEMGAMVPEAGGLYVYLRDTFGRLPAFLYGWSMFFAISSGSVATLAVAAAGYLNQIVPLTPVMGKVVSVAMVAAVGYVNARGTRHGAMVQNWATAIKVAAILLMAVALMSLGTGMREADRALVPESVDVALLSGMGLAMIGVLWAYEGWQYVTFSAGEAQDPQRTFPRGIVLGTTALIGVYLLANVAYLAALGPEAAGQSEAVAADAVRAVLGPGAGTLIAGAIVISMFGAANGITLTAPRVYFAMARDGVFFQRLAEVHRGDRQLGVGGRAGAVGDVRAAADVRGVRGVDLLRPWRHQSLPLPPLAPRRGAAVPSAGVSVDAHPVRPLGGGDRGQYAVRAAGAGVIGVGGGAAGDAGVLPVEAEAAGTRSQPALGGYDQWRVCHEETSGLRGRHGGWRRRLVVGCPRWHHDCFSVKHCGYRGGRLLRGADRPKLPSVGCCLTRGENWRAP